jgi:hypothetical protein
MMRPVRWWSGPAIKLHLTLVAGLTLCAIGSWVEWHRALEGVALAWAYAFEWPLFAVLGTAVWWRLLHDKPPRPGPRSGRSRGPTIAEDDPGLVAWRAYLASLQSAEGDGDISE